MIDEEFDRQRDLLVTVGAQAAGLRTEELTEAVEPLRDPLKALAGAPGRAPVDAGFVLVLSETAVRAEKLVPHVRLGTSVRPGIVDRNHGGDDLAGYRPLAELAVPGGAVYAMVDVDRGEEFCGVRPQDAVAALLARDRTPLTIHEGLSLALLFPAVLEKNKCFMLAGSRRGDRRVPALWISDKAPKLGWCWDGNPHSWLGTASAGGRIGAAVGAECGPTQTKG